MQQAITYDTTKRYHIAGVLTTCLHYLIISHTATESNRHTTRMKIRRSVVSSTFIFPHPPEDEKKKKNTYRSLSKDRTRCEFRRIAINLRSHRQLDGGVYVC